MNKKELRKELEHTLISAIEDVLNKKNTEAAQKITNAIHAASKKISKNFFKTRTGAKLLEKRLDRRGNRNCTAQHRYSRSERARMRSRIGRC